LGSQKHLLSVKNARGGNTVFVYFTARIRTNRFTHYLPTGMAEKSVVDYTIASWIASRVHCYVTFRAEKLQSTFAASIRLQNVDKSVNDGDLRLW